MSEHRHALAALVCCLRDAPGDGAIAPPDWAPVLKIANDHLLTPALWSALGKSGACGRAARGCRRISGDAASPEWRPQPRALAAGDPTHGCAQRAGNYTCPAQGRPRAVRWALCGPGGAHDAGPGHIGASRVERRRHRGTGAAGLSPRPAVCDGSPCVWRFRPAERPGRRRSPHRAGRSVPCFAGVGSVGPCRAPANRRRPLLLTLRHRRIMHNLLHAQIHHLGNFYRGELQLQQVYELVALARNFGPAVNWCFVQQRMRAHRLTTALESSFWRLTACSDSSGRSPVRRAWAHVCIT